MFGGRLRRAWLGAALVTGGMPVFCLVACDDTLGIAGLEFGCTPGIVECSKNTLRTCNGEGRWEDVELCAGKTCDADARKCVGECELGTRRCVDDMQQQCVEGGIWRDGELCDEGSCRGGECQSECAPGDVRCDDTGTPQRCDEDGGWTSIGPCEDNTPRTCHENRWEENPRCDGQTCVGGECVGECEVGRKNCYDDTPRTCVFPGTWKSGNPCLGDLICKDGICVPEPDAG